MSEPKRVLTLHLKGEYWRQIRNGDKTHEYRLCTPRNCRLLEGKEFDRVNLWLGYPPGEQIDKLLIRGCGGVTRTTITHEHFGPDKVEVFDIKLTKIES